MDNSSGSLEANQSLSGKQNGVLPLQPENTERTWEEMSESPQAFKSTYSEADFIHSGYRAPHAILRHPNPAHQTKRRDSALLRHCRSRNHASTGDST